MERVWIIAAKITPVLLLIALGKVLNRTGILKKDSVDTLRKLIVHVGLPAVMFLSFLEVKLELRYAFIVLGMFALNLLLLFAGRLAAKWTGKPSDRFLFTGFEYGMLAFALFSIVYGRENIPLIALIVLGHELFIWFIYVPAIRHSAGDKPSITTIVKDLITSPIIIGIILGLLLNILGWGQRLFSAPALQGVKATLETLGGLTGPLILLVLGAGLVFSKQGLGKALKVLAIRLPLVILLIFAVGYGLFYRVLQLPTGFSIALAVLLISPPPFVIPVFLPDEADNGDLSMVLTLFTTISLILFLLIVIRFPEIS